MRKITSFILGVLAFAGFSSTADAQTTETSPTDLPQLTTDESAPVWYTIKNVRKGKYATYAGDAAAMTQQATPSLASCFYFTGSVAEGVLTVKIHNSAAGTKLAAEANSWTETGRDWYIKAVTTTGLSISKDANFSGHNSWNDYQGKGETIDYWDADDAGSIWQIESVSSLYQETKAFAQNLNNHAGQLFYPTAESGAAIAAAIPAAEPTTVEGYIQAIEGINNAISAIQYAMPEVGKDYYLKNLNYGTYLGIKSTCPSVHTVQIPDDNNLNRLREFGQEKNDIAEVWTLEAGSQEGYYKFNNKATGKYVAAYSNDVASSPISLGDEAGEFKIHAADGGRYGTASIGYDAVKTKWHMSGGKDLVSWEIQAPATSWYFEPVGDELSNLKNNRFASMGEQAADAVNAFGVSEDEGYKAAATTFESTPTYENGVALFEAAKAAIEKQPFRIQSTVTGDENLLASDGSYGRSYADTKSDANTIWKLTAVENGFKLHNLNTDKYLGVLSQGPEAKAGMTDYQNGAKFTIEGEKATGYKIKDGNGNQMYCETTGYINSWNEGERSLWYVTPATDFEVSLTPVGDASYATAYLPFAVSANGAKLYTAQQNAQNANVVDAVETQQIPAEQGFIIEGSAATVTLNILTAEPAAVENNVLTGSLLGQTGINKADYYILGNGDNGLGFYHPNKESLDANKAFIAPQNTQAASLRLNFGGDVTGINGATVNPATDNQPIYDLSGRRVEKATKGIYIQGGKKVLVK